MAYNENELHVKADVQPGEPRFYPVELSPKTFAAVGSATTLKRGTPVAVDTTLGTNGQWIAWDNANANGGNVIRGFLFDDVDLLVGEEVLGVVMTAGQFHRDDVIDPATGNPQSATGNATLDAALRVGPRGLGMVIQGLDAVR